MFSKKTKLKLTDFECNLLINGMNEFRNMLLSDGICIQDLSKEANTAGQKNIINAKIVQTAR